MVDLRQLEQLITIAEKGTLSAAAAELHLSQSALSRSMQRLEAEMGVPLFTHSKNRSALSPVGERGVEYARLLLNTAAHYTAELRLYAAQLSTLMVGASAPAPLWRLSTELHERFPGKTVAEELQEAGPLLEGLRRGYYSLILTHTPVEEPGILCRKYVEDQLLLELPARHPLSARDVVTLADMQGLTVLTYRNLGVWSERLGQMTGVHFIEQTDLDVLSDLVMSSDLPNLASELFHTPTAHFHGRVSLPIADDMARIPFYLCARESDRALLQRLC